MNADTVSASLLSLRTAQVLLELAAGLARTATALALSEEDVTTPQEVASFAARLLELDPDITPGHHDQDDRLGELEQARIELGDARRFAVDAYELLDHAAAHLTKLQQQEGDYDRAAWLEQARPLLAANPYHPTAHLPEGQRPRLIEADRLRLAAYTIHTADALHLAARAGNPALLDQAVSVYEHARRLYAHATGDAIGEVS